MSSVHDARVAIEACGLQVIAVLRDGRHIRLRCRDNTSGRVGLIPVHHGSHQNSRFIPSVRSQARAIARGTYHAPEIGR